MAGVSKIVGEKNQKILLDLVSQPGNDICADCKARNPRWASYNLGIFLCMNCASIHRKIGTHITKVKSITMDTWTKEQVEPMKSIGNIKSNTIYVANEIRNPPPPNLMDAERDSELEQYIRSKYQFKRFMNKSALVASKLGPSRSLSTYKDSVPSSGKPPASPSPKPLPSAVSSPSVSTQAPAALPQRRSTVTSASAAAAAPPQPSPRQASGQYPPPQAAPSQATASGVAAANNGNGVWADLISLQSPSRSSSLPLQFQAPSQLSPIIPQGYQTSLVTGLNPFQQQPAISNPYSQQLYPNAGPSSATYPSPSPFTPQHTLPFAAQQPLMQNTSNIFHPQPHQAMQPQVPTTSQTLFFNVQTGAIMGPTTNPGPFLSTSPAVFPSHSPVTTTPQPPFSTTPQPQMFSTTPQPLVQPSAPSMFMMTPSQQFQMQQQGGLGISTTSQPHQVMNMGQPLYSTTPLQAPMTNMAQGQYGGVFQQQLYAANGFTGGQQWGAM